MNLGRHCSNVIKKCVSDSVSDVIEQRVNDVIGERVNYVIEERVSDIMCVTTDEGINVRLFCTRCSGVGVGLR